MPFNWSFLEKDSFQVLHPFSSTIKLSVWGTRRAPAGAAHPQHLTLKRGLTCTAMRYSWARGQDRMLKPSSLNRLSQNTTVPSTALPKWHSLCQDHVEPAAHLLVKAHPNNPRPKELISSYESVMCYTSKSTVGSIKQLPHTGTRNWKLDFHTFGHD